MCAAHRRVTNPLIPFCERWLPFLPGMRANRARHARVYELYDDMLKQLEVGLGIMVRVRFRDALLHVACGWRRVFLLHAHFCELYDRHAEAAGGGSRWALSPCGMWVATGVLHCSKAQ